MPEAFALLLAGFSVCCSVLLLLAYFFVYRLDQHSLLAKSACVVLLSGLAATQLFQLAYLLHGGDLAGSRTFASLLLLLPPAFYFLSREVLQFQPKLCPRLLLHSLPLLISLGLPAPQLLPLAFLLGTGYALWLAQQVRRLRAHHPRGTLELLAWGLFLLMAASLLGLSISAPMHVVVVCYTSLIGLAFLLVLFVLLKYPELVSDTQEAVRTNHVVSTLNKVDCDALLQRLDTLMQTERLYMNENLNLAMLAEALEIGAHQLSELVNTRHGVSFSRYIREQRVAAARRMLIDEPDASVLSVGLSVGFTSQSNFYAAFREIAGETPGQFRKKAGLSST